MRTRVGLLVAIIVAGVGCTRDGVLLRYDLTPGHAATYDWSIRAKSTVDSPTDQSSRTVVMEAELEETIRAGVTPDKPILSLRLRPLKLTDEGRELPLPPPSIFEYEIGPGGRINLLVSADLPPGVASSVEIENLVSESRPPLPSREVGIGDSFRAPLKLSSQKSSIDLKGTGTLVGFDLKDRRRLAKLELRRSGSVASSQPAGTGESAAAALTLTGITKTNTVSEIDIDDGVLFSTSYRSSANFDLSLANTPTGKLRVRVESDLTLTSETG